MKLLVSLFHLSPRPLLLIFWYNGILAFPTSDWVVHTVFWMRLRLWLICTCCLLAGHYFLLAESGFLLTSPCLLLTAVPLSSLVLTSHGLVFTSHWLDLASDCLPIFLVTAPINTRARCPADTRWQSHPVMRQSNLEICLTPPSSVFTQSS